MGAHIAASDTDEPVGRFDESSDIGWCDPLPADGRQVFVSRLTGDGACLSNVDGHFVLPRLREQVADRWYPDTFQVLADIGLEQFGRVASEYDADVVTDFQRPIDGEVQWNRGASRIGAAGRDHVDRLHESSVRSRSTPPRCEAPGCRYAARGQDVSTVRVACTDAASDSEGHATAQHPVQQRED